MKLSLINFLSNPRGQASEQTRRDLGFIFKDGIFFSLMVGMGETYLPAFVLAVGLGEVLAGWVATVPLLVGALVQLISPWGVGWVRSFRRWVVLCALLQSLSFIPLVIGAVRGWIGAIPVLIIASLYWAAGLGTSAAWNTWVEKLVPASLRPSFFGHRSRWAHTFVFVGLAAGGMLLEWGKDLGKGTTVFAILFLCAAIFRLISAFCLAQHSEPPGIHLEQEHLHPFQVFRRFIIGSEERLLLYLLMVQFAVQVSAPFFTPYMLVELKFSYWQYMVMLGSSFLGKFVFATMLGRYAEKNGPIALLKIGSWGIVPISLLWVLNDSFPYLMGVQFFSGVAWATFELGTLFLFFENLPHAHRVSILTLFNFMNAVAVVLGSLVGGLFLKYLGTDRDIYFYLFSLSFGLRALSLLYLPRIGTITFKTLPMEIRTLAVRPNSGTIDRPILPSIPD